MGVELDLAGQRIVFADQELVWLRSLCKAAAGSSATAAELASLLGVGDKSRHRRGPIVLQRGDQRLLRSLLAGRDLPGEATERLRLLLEGDPVADPGRPLAG